VKDNIFSNETKWLNESSLSEEKPMRNINVMVKTILYPYTSLLYFLYTITLLRWGCDDGVLICTVGLTVLYMRWWCWRLCLGCYYQEVMGSVWCEGLDAFCFWDIAILWARKGYVWEKWNNVREGRKYMWRTCV